MFRNFILRGWITGLIIAGILGFTAYGSADEGSLVKDKDGFILSWLVCGPFPNYLPDDQTDYGHHAKLCWGYAQDFFAKCGGEAGISPSEGMECPYEGSQKIWKKHTSANRIIDFNTIFPPGTNSVAYAYCEIDVPEAIEGVITAGSDDGIKIWLNHKLVFDQHIAQGIAENDDTLPANFKKGKNQLLVKVDNDWGGFGFCLRIATTEKEKLGIVFRDKLFFEQKGFLLTSNKENASLKIALRGAPLEKYPAEIEKIKVASPDGQVKEFKEKRNLKDEILFSPEDNLSGLYQFTITIRDSSGEKKDLAGGFWYLPPTSSKGYPLLSFVQISDIHVTDKNTGSTFIEDIKEINALTDKPALVFATGDLVSNGNNESEYEEYKQGMIKFKIPLCNVVGNHDWPPGNYNKHLGPDYYSFDLAQKHFIVLDCVDPSRCAEWLKKDLENQPAKKEIIVFQHYQPDKALLDLLSQHNTKGLFYGHWHSNKTFYYNKILVVSTPSLRFGGIDCAPRGFRVVTLDKKEGLKTEYRWAGISKQVSILTPAGDVVNEGESIPIKVNAYDTSTDIKGIQYSIDAGKWQLMKHAGGWLWQASQKNKGISAGPHTVRIKVIPDSGAPWEKEEKFNYAGETPQFYLTDSLYAGGQTGMSAPVIEKGRLYLSIQDDNNAKNGGVVCLDSRTGKVVWNARTGESVNGRPVLSDGMVCAVSVIGTVYGLDARSGRELWRYSLGSFWDRWVYSSPVISEGKVYCGVAPYFAALDLKSGKEIWRSASLGGDWISGRTSPVADDKKVYVGFNWSNGLFALDKQTGAVVWNKKEGFATTHSSPVVDNNIVYYAADNKLYALEKDTGKEWWSSKLEGDWTVASPAVKDSVLVIGSPDGKVMAFDKGTGNKLWSFQTGPSIGSFSAYVRGGSQVMAAPLISGDTIYIGANDGNLYALNLKTGGNLWKYNLGMPILATPVVDNGLLYVTTYDGNVYVFKKKGGGAF